MAHGAPDHRLVIDLVELVKLINKIEEITTIAEITTLKNLESLDLVDRITRIDAIDSLGEISIAKVVPLISPPLLLYDDFDSGILKWSHTGDGRLELSNERAFSGSGSMRMHTGPGTGDLASATRDFAVSEDLTMRVVARFSLPQSDAAYFGFSLSRMTPTTRLMGTVEYRIATKKWVYRVQPEWYKDVPGGAQDLKLDPDVWHRIELECNFSTGKFVKLRVDALSMDMSAIDLWSDGASYPEFAEIVVGIKASPDKIVDAYIDDVYAEAW